MFVMNYVITELLTIELMKASREKSKLALISTMVVKKIFLHQLAS